MTTLKIHNDVVIDGVTVLDGVIFRSNGTGDSWFNLIKIEIYDYLYVLNSVLSFTSNLFVSLITFGDYCIYAFYNRNSLLSFLQSFIPFVFYFNFFSIFISLTPSFISQSIPVCSYLRQTYIHTFLAYTAVWTTDNIFDPLLNPPPIQILEPLASKGWSLKSISNSNTSLLFSFGPSLT